MLLRLGYDMQFESPEPVACVAQLRLHPSRAATLSAPDVLQVEPAIPLEEYVACGDTAAEEQFFV
jgi:hypothetical protein